MPARYLAHGLELCSTFELPGMRRVDTQGLPELRLRLVRGTGTGLDAGWSGTDMPPVWRGELGYGHTLMLQLGVDGDLLFTYSDRARFHLDSDYGTLSCAPSRAGLEWQRVLIARVVSAISVLRGYEALHASAVLSPWGAVAIAAPAGTGKTTLALELVRRGWPLLSDDVLSLCLSPEGVLGLPASGHATLDPHAHATGTQLGSLLGVLDREWWIAVHETARAPCPMRAIFMLERDENLTGEVELLEPSPLCLAPYMLGLLEDKDRERTRFELYSDLVAQAKLRRLTGGAGEEPARLADMLERALDADAPVLQLGSSG